ncbi:hypothetical protein [Bifidobacterium callitrichidarum]|uniref:hypothetical protein n=1 Tax=Bifidobacterium callitrichidarum TaxID=2052941 RepID=UPI0011B1EA65|nr:hypothetical protein [Bifidobacterium callitrichidarum]
MPLPNLLEVAQDGGSIDYPDITSSLGFKVRILPDDDGNAYELSGENPGIRLTIVDDDHDLGDDPHISEIDHGTALHRMDAENAAKVTVQWREEGAFAATSYADVLTIDSAAYMAAKPLMARIATRIMAEASWHEQDVTTLDNLHSRLRRFRSAVSDREMNAPECGPKVAVWNAMMGRLELALAQAKDRAGAIREESERKLQLLLLLFVVISSGGTIFEWVDRIPFACVRTTISVLVVLALIAAGLIGSRWINKGAHA